MQANYVGFPMFTMMSSILPVHSMRCSKYSHLMLRFVPEPCAAIAPPSRKRDIVVGTALAGSHGRSPRVLAANQFQSTSVKRDFGHETDITDKPTAAAPTLQGDFTIKRIPGCVADSSYYPLAIKANYCISVA
jgi:hypothetical protein